MSLILALNCGSSSLKHAAFDVCDEQEHVVSRGEVAGLGATDADHTDAVHQLLDDLARQKLVPDAVGHRIVHGGPDLCAPQRVDRSVLAALRTVVPLAPLHLPIELDVIETVRNRLRLCPQVVCFDTAFHRTLSPVARRYALPESVVSQGISRYGFHGLSYEYVVAKLGAEALGRSVIAHLGSGASTAAIRDGRSVDTTMGISPAGGLVMGTRTGDLDPGVLLYLASHGSSLRELDKLVNSQGGLLGVSGRSADVRELLARRTTDASAALALDVFTWSARKWIGALTATLGGLDTLVFTGGIGENSAVVRAEIAHGLAYLGVLIDPLRNAADRRDDATHIISKESAACTVHVVHTDEERMVARQTQNVLSGATPMRNA